MHRLAPPALRLRARRRPSHLQPAHHQSLARTPPAGAPPAAGAPGGGGGGGRGRGGPPALTRNVPLDRQERYDNLVFPRGGGPGVLASGRGGGPNVENGKKTFDTVCAKCHRVDTFGNTYGPDLSNIQTMPRRDILRAIFFPDEKVDPKYETTVIVTRDKQTIRGLVVSEDGAERHVEDGGDGRSGHGPEIADFDPDERANVDHAGRAAGHGGRQRDSRRGRRI